MSPFLFLIFILPLAVESFAEFFREFVALGGTRATLRLPRERLHVPEKPLIPAVGLGGGKMLGHPGMGFVGVGDGTGRNPQGIGHALIPCFVRACSFISSRLRVRPAFMSAMP